MIALGSAGAFTAIKDVIGYIVSKHAQKTIYLKYKGSEIKLEGFSQKEGLALLEKLLASAQSPKPK